MRRRTLALAAGFGLLLVASGGVSGPAHATGHGHGHTPVTICHNGHTITVDDSALHAHVKHGDTLGECPAPTPEPTTPVETPEPEPSTPAPTPTEVVEPRVQDYVKCTGAAFVLDNSSSTVAVRYTVAGKSFDVPAGAVVHTDADGYLFPTDVGPYTITTHPGDTSWTFAPPTDCEATTPPTTEPTTPPTTTEPTTPPTTEPTTPPTDEPTSPVTPPTGEPTTPVPSDAPTTPVPASPTPTAETTPRGESPSPSAPSSAPTGSPAPVAESTSRRTDTLAFTGAGDLILPGLLALGLLATGAIMLAQRRAARSRANSGPDGR
jgi:outer membrane biosynthesis protein TonB